MDSNTFVDTLAFSESFLKRNSGIIGLAEVRTLSAIFWGDKLNGDYNSYSKLPCINSRIDNGN
jgi:hypothetical protein